MSKSSLDSIDLEIIRLLLRNPNISGAEVSKKIGRSPGAVSNRINKLKTRGIIEGYKFDFRKICDFTCQRMLFKLAIGSEEHVPAALEYFGKFDFVMSVRKLHSDHFDLVVDYIVFLDDYKSGSGHPEGSEAIQKAQALRGVPINLVQTVRLEEFDPVAENYSFLSTLLDRQTK